MTNDILYYSPKLDILAKEAIQQNLDLKVLNLSKIQQGEFNHVYQVTTPKQKLVMRVFRQTEWPPEGNMEWLEQQFLLHKIPHAKMLYYTRDNNFFPHGFMVLEFIEGKSGHQVIEEGLVSFKEFHNQLAEVLNKIHQVTIKKFGQINQGEGEQNSFCQNREDFVKNKFKLLETEEILEPKVQEEVILRIRKLLQPLEGKIQPILTHGDPTPDNCLWTPQGKIVLIDWDGAQANSWIKDYAWLTYFASHLSSQGSREQRQQWLKESFQHYHSINGLSWQEIEIIEKVYHLCFVCDLLGYYYFNLKNMDAFQKAQTRLKELLSL